MPGKHGNITDFLQSIRYVDVLSRHINPGLFKFDGSNSCAIPLGSQRPVFLFLQKIVAPSPWENWLFLRQKDVMHPGVQTAKKRKKVCLISRRSQEISRRSQENVLRKRCFQYFGTKPSAHAHDISIYECTVVVLSRDLGVFSRRERVFSRHKQMSWFVRRVVFRRVCCSWRGVSFH